jgi:acetyl esterase/lipase
MTGPVLDPEFAHLAEFDIGIGPGADLEPIRSAVADLAPPPEASDAALAEHVHIGPEPRVLVETFRPTGAGPHPALVWFHGGGYVIGAPSMDRLRMQSWAERFDCFVASVDYRLAPEHPFPAAHDDAMAALGWVLRSAGDIDVDPERVVVGGASAGAGLAAGVALAARDRGLGLAGQLLFYPMLDDRQQTPSSRWRAAVWSPPANQFGWRSYLGDAYGGDVSDYAAPSRTSSYEGLAPAIVLVGGADGFFDEDLAYAAQLTRAGVPTDVRVYAGAPHGFDLVAPESSVAALAGADAERWLERVLHPST